MNPETARHTMVREYRSVTYKGYGDAIESCRKPWLVCSCGHTKQLDLDDLRHDERLARVEHQVDILERLVVSGQAISDTRAGGGS
jgi:hypothetical protein